MASVLNSIPYVASAILFILSLRGLSSQETARRGNLYGMIGMTIALLVALSATSEQAMVWLLGAVVIGSLIGVVMAVRVAMTAMPEMVALLHSFVGAAAVLVGFGSFIRDDSEGAISPTPVPRFAGTEAGRKRGRARRTGLPRSRHETGCRRARPVRRLRIDRSADARALRQQARYQCDMRRRFGEAFAPKL